MGTSGGFSGGTSVVAWASSAGGAMPEREAAELLADVLAGDRRAAERLVEATYRQVYASLFRLCGGDAELAADLTQDTFRKAWQSLSGFDGRSQISTWLYRIAYNTFLNHVRRPRPVELPDEMVARLVADGPDVADSLTASETGDRLRRAVLALPDDLRFAISAHFWSDLPVREIARLEGITTVGVRKRLKRAFQALRLALEETSR
jgi:RNA polymerase sigma-70 factor (ECF subfamily)